MWVGMGIICPCLLLLIISLFFWHISSLSYRPFLNKFFISCSTPYWKAGFRLKKQVNQAPDLLRPREAHLKHCHSPMTSRYAPPFSRVVGL